MTAEREARPAGAPVRRGRGRRPADEVRAEVLAAAGALLLREGMAAFTIERVAQEAAVSKTTLYKWWPSRGTLALDGYFHAVESTLAFPDTGDIRADLTAQVRAFVRLLAGTSAGRVIAELIGQAQTDPALSAALLERYSGPRRDLAVARLRRAQEQGRLRADADPRILVDQLWGACYHRLLLPNEPLTEEFAARLVDNLLRGVAA
ncbi:TetR-like C-terminal domain-containing protein [Streptomyces griseoviridis]|uniref:TetR family transcriptional regulator n=2 Tax=Streptomyces TaxID=1883 RepID=A0A918L7M4_STRGD|nr:MULTISPECIES: TetR-like C-terminal domain-containing protein [Streptomyces]GGS17763.1 TetR family transcriptional regulator [Streptomyces niveoruber]GGU33026.1 TetR family transcriptional regulator [Streptomyces daghestanicus]GHI34139.1 TetR family transcriptional regulator [Streptomyces daghestanicus]